MDLLIRGARIVDCSHDFYGDVYIRDGKIDKLGSNLYEDCQSIEGKGLVLLPSFIDLHCHFRDPGFTYKEDIFTGSLAAVRGGYTAVNLMANTKPVASSMDVVSYVLKKAHETAFIDIHQTVSITVNMEGRDVSHLDKIDSRVKFISDDGKGVLSDRVMLGAMKKAYFLGNTVISHAENAEITGIDDRLSENLMTARDLVLCESTGCRLHMAHVSTKEAMSAIISAKLRGIPVTCEVTPHHIALTNETNYSVNPPLREKEDVEFLINAVKDGWVDAISTDHAPHTREDKKNGAPGISGLETAFCVCYTTLVKGGHITLGKLSELMSGNPAGIMKLNKGRIDIGYDGDMVLVDTESKNTVSAAEFHSKGKNTPFEGREYYGRVITTIKGGRVVYEAQESGEKANDN